MEKIKSQINKGDLFGGLAAMLVALPSAIAFGLIIYAPLGPSLVSRGALTGVLGTIAIGLVASVANGTPRLISAPCAPAAAVLASFVGGALMLNGSTSQGSSIGIPPSAIPAALMAITLLAGLSQFVFGFLGGGKFIKYIPYPVVAGYLSGVGVLIILGQLPQLFGLAEKLQMSNWSTQIGKADLNAVSVGATAMIVMAFADKITKKIPATILALAGGMLCYWLCALFQSHLQNPQNNPLVIGPLRDGGASFSGMLVAGWSDLFRQFGQIIIGLKSILITATTLAVLLSIDTLKTCVVVDAMTRSRHDSNRELMCAARRTKSSCLQWQHQQRLTTSW